jgi:hypothetical protein
MHSAPTCTRISLAATSGAVRNGVCRMYNRNRNNNVSLLQADD